MKTFQQALITGATSGIGEALAELIAEKKIPLILTGRNAAKLEELKERLSQKVPVETIVADLQAKEERGKIVKLIHARQVDLLINNAGFGLYGSILSHSTQEWLQMLELDAAAVLELTVEAAKSLDARGQKGTIMNIASAAAFQVFPTFAVYAAAKAFVTSFSQSLDYDLKDKGIRVLVACPGKVATGFAARASSSGTKPSPNGLVMSREYAAEAIWKQIEQEKRLNIFDWHYKLGTYLSYFLPNALIVKFTQGYMKKYH